MAAHSATQPSGNRSIPIVDLSPFVTNGDIESRKRAARELADKAHANGCIGITGYGVRPAMIADLFATTKKLFDLPYEEKMKAPHPAGITPHRGYSGIGKENAGGKTKSEETAEAKRDDY